MSQFRLKKLFKPDAIAVVGASETESKVGCAVMKNLIEGGFDGDIIPVNPKHRRIFNRPASASVADLEQGVDLAVVATPIRTVTKVVSQCVDRDVKCAIILSAGGKEVGKEGKKIEADINAKARQGNLRILGPNCLGVAYPKMGLNASFAAHMPYQGNMAFISQSGAICTAILGISIQKQIGFSHFVSVGSMLDVDFGDLIDYFGNDPNVESILLYVENIANVRKFLSAARAVSRVKPIVLLKAGKSSTGAQAAASHTGAMAGEDALYDAAFKRAGIIRVKNLAELFECAELIAKKPRPRGNRLGIISNSGGGGVMAADALSDYDTAPAGLSDETLAKLDKVLPPYWSRNNPVDILGDATPQRYAKAVESFFDAKEIDGLLIILNPQAMTAAEKVAEAIIDALKNRWISVFTAFTGGVDVAEAHRLFSQAGIPTYDTPEHAIRAFMYMYEYERNLNFLYQIPPRLQRDLAVDQDHAGSVISANLGDNPRFLTESDSKDLLAAYGLPVVPTRVAATVDEAVRIANEMGYPVTLKIHSKDFSHKSDAGGVALDLSTEEALRRAYDQIMTNARQFMPDAAISGVTVEPMISRPDLEVLVGTKKDLSFGPVIMFGTGGIFTEIIKDRAIALPPLNRLLVRHMVDDTQISKLLKGYRNLEPADMESIEEMVIRLSQLVIDFPQITEVDMNPVIMKKGRPHVADARIRVESTEVFPPAHLAISPYPKEYESWQRTEEGVSFFVRPVQPEDAPLFEELFEQLSRESVYYRFFSVKSKLSPKMLARFTQVDYDRQIALVAIWEENGRERMLGACRIMTDPDGKEGEFAVTVGDPWQGCGIGVALLQQCLQIAKQRRIQHVSGIVLPENRQMLNLGRKLGFEIANVSGSTEKEMHINLKRYQP